MPLIRLTAPTGSLTEEGRAAIRQDLAAAVLRWEGFPDTAFFRGLSWSYLTELPEGVQGTAGDDAPRFLAEVTVPQGTPPVLDKSGLIEDVTRAVLKAAGLSRNDASRVWVLVHEQPEGSWGAGGSVVHHADLAALAEAQRSVS
ncbi:4-oxalocrotonate tautomerase family protein [Streptomyces sp. NBC_00654]|uniref:tautomerase family protein n=1 Tax=Streptomyces sp. NBC_00654 TaxID=2975799 RepID=UPI00224C7FF9|nr:tautomerase family protein [Streptomyces sp. NBC_00654]MCX4963608.1 4-oxalocrotonate tautomerase family protein [Streptomyces sp. NBC_00654]